MLVTTLTKRLAEDLSYYLAEQGVKCNGCIASSTPSSAVELLRELREGRFEALVGVNLLAKASTCRRFRWWRFSTPTKKAFFAAKRR